MSELSRRFGEARRYGESEEHMPGLIQRDRLAGMIPEPVSREIFQGVVEQSAVLKAGRRLPNMTSKTQSINVLDMLPMA